MNLIAVVCMLAWMLGMASGVVLGGFIHLLLVAAVVLVLVRLIDGAGSPRPEKKVKIQFKVDPDALAKAQQQIRDLQDALRFYVDRSDEVGEQLELAGARIDMLRRHRTEIVERVEGIFHMARWIQGDRDTAEAEVVRLKEMVERLRGVWSQTGKIAARRLGDLAKAKLEIDQLTVQMAGVSVAALGWSTETAKRGDYGWSVPYQDALNLRQRYDRLRTLVHPEVVEEIEESLRGQ